MCLLRFCSPISPVYTDDIAAWRRSQKGDAMTFVAGQVTWHPHRLGTTFFTEARQTKETHYISSNVRRAKTALQCPPAPAARAVLLNARCRCWVDAVSWFTPLVLFVQPLNFATCPYTNTEPKIAEMCSLSHKFGDAQHMKNSYAPLLAAWRGHGRDQSVSGGFTSQIQARFLAHCFGFFLHPQERPETILKDVR